MREAEGLSLQSTRGEGERGGVEASTQTGIMRKKSKDEGGGRGTRDGRRMPSVVFAHMSVLCYIDTNEEL